MRKIIPLKFFSRLLLIVMLTVTINGVYESAHAMRSQVDDQDIHSELSLPHQNPCSPLEQHKDYDGCNTCINCACQAPLTVQPFKFSYNPSVQILQISDPFKFLPEVYLSRFIPPQKQA